jgi:hypothetical protein
VDEHPTSEEPNPLAKVVDRVEHDRRLDALVDKLAHWPAESPMDRRRRCCAEILSVTRCTRC